MEGSQLRLLATGHMTKRVKGRLEVGNVVENGAKNLRWQREQVDGFGHDYDKVMMGIR